MTVFSY